jgi:uncharacterized protein YndB with AHSA1/START domain
MGWLLLALAWAQTTVDIDIAASPERVWQVLVGFDEYADWNPWLIEAHGDAAPGGVVHAVVVLGEQARKASHRVTDVVPNERFCWRDRGWFTPLARGWRCRTLTRTEEGTHLRVELGIRGPFRGMVERRFGEAMRTGLQRETEALATRAVTD